MIPIRAAAALVVGISATALAQPRDPSPPPTTNPSYITAAIVKPQKVAATDERVAALKVPQGFRVTKFAEGLGKPRMLAIAPDGGVLVSRRDAGDVLRLADADNDGRADGPAAPLLHLPDAHGLAVHGDTLYVVSIKECFAAPIEPGGRLGPIRRVADNLPDAGQHPNKTLAVGPDGMLYLSAGSTANAAYEKNKEAATLLKVRPDGGGREIYASGLRNTIGFAFHPGTKQLWGFDHGIDWLGDDFPPEELNRIDAGGFYGWPFLWGDNQVNPADDPSEHGLGSWDELKTSAKPPVLGYTAHAAPMQMAFYAARQFPPEFRGDAFVAMHGSWNRTTPSGYEVLRAHFDDAGNPQKLEPFVTGFLSADGKQYSGRPCGLVVARDGALLVSDDANGVIYRVAYDTRVGDAR